MMLFVHLIYYEELASLINCGLLTSWRKWAKCS